jgi:hypothetical protein
LAADAPVFRSLFDAPTFAQFERQIAGYAFADAQVVLEQAAKGRGLA